MFTSNASKELSSTVRAGTLTLSSSTTSDIVHLSVNSTNTAIYSDATFSTTSGMAPHDGNNRFFTAGTNSAGKLAARCGSLGR